MHTAPIYRFTRSQASLRFFLVTLKFQKYFDYSEFNVSVGRDKRTVEEKTNIMWLDALTRMRQRLGDTQTRIITIADREGDFYEFLHPLIEKDEQFVIRSQHNRILGETYHKGAEKLHNTLRNASPKGSI